MTYSWLPDRSRAWTAGFVLVSLGILLLLVAPLPAGAYTPQNEFPVPLLIIALAFWVIGVYVRVQKPRDPLARRLYWLTMAFAGALALSSPAANHVVWARIPEVAAYAVIPGLFFSSFRWIATGSRPVGWASVLTRSFYAAGTVLSLSFVLKGLLTGEWPLVLSDLLLLLLLLGIISGLACLLYANARPLSDHHRNQVGIVLLGQAAAILPFIVLSVIPTIVNASPVLSAYMTALAMVFSPLSLAYAVVWRQLLGIEVVIRRTLVYGLMTALLAGCYAAFLYGLRRAGLNSYNADPLLWVIFFAAVTLTFTTVRDALRGLIDRLIYRDRYDRARVLRELGAQLASVQPLDEVMATVARRLEEAMNLTGVAILLRRVDGTPAIHATTGICSDAAAAETLLHQATENDFQSDPGHWTPLVAKDEELGVIYLGPKCVPGQLTAEDITLIETLAGQAAVAAANALLISRLHTKVAEMELLRDQLLHVEDEERKRLAQELHDDGLQMVLALVRQAASAAADPSVDGRATDRFHRLAELGRDIAYQLRQTCSYLYPSELTHLGLATALRKLAETTNMDEQILVRVTGQASGRLEMCEEIQEVLYRVAREAITNTVRHSGATVAEINLEVRHPYATLCVRDNGRGFTVPHDGALGRQGHLGLVGMRDRVERVGGEFTVRSSPGAGTEIEVRIEVPIGAAVHRREQALAEV